MGRIAGGSRTMLSGNLHPKALPEADQGPVDPGLELARVTLILKPSASQQSALQQLLAEQQDPASPNYHHWLTPEEYASRFGVSPSDLNQIAAWLQSQNLTVTGMARGRDWIAASGSAAAVESAFGAPIHRYSMNGELHFANAAEPSVPPALDGMVAGIRGLNDFRLRPASRARGAAGTAAPRYNNNNPCDVHCLAPDDLAAIYNIAPLFNSGLNGSGQKLVVLGQTQIRLADIEQFRSSFNLPANDPQVMLVPGDADPGISTTGDLSEADLDLELSGAVARNASILYVYSSDVMTSAQYAIDQNLAPVMSISYGDCEASYAASDAASMEAMAQKANALGITWFAASGDNGATDCAGDGFPGATSMVAVDLPGSLPEVTGIGGTEFTEGSGSYWSATNTSNNASALGYIPETAWNDTAASGSPAASGGGRSTYFAKPSWQTGTGVPNDGARDVPDLAVSASADHDGYVIFTSDSTVCGSGRRGATTQCESVFGGTSVGAPTFAGLAAVLNQAVVTAGLQASGGLGNINPTLYGLVRSAPAAFHDVTTGNNMITVTCGTRQTNCTPGPVGYSAGVGYDPVTGLGSVDANALFTAWLAGRGGHITTSQPAITAFGNGASYNQIYAPGMILTIYGSQLAQGPQAASSVPLPPQMAGVTVTVNGVTAPLWYVSQGQINAQIPYETPVGTSVELTVTNNGQSATASFVAAATAPGIFTDEQGAPVPFTSAAAGQILTMYVTGVGAVTPSIEDGAAPPADAPLAGLPVPLYNTTVTVGGVNAPIQFAGIPWGLVGIVQINYQVPAGLAPGAQPVVVTVNGVMSKAATLTVTQ